MQIRNSIRHDESVQDGVFVDPRFPLGHALESLDPPGEELEVELARGHVFGFLNFVLLSPDLS